MRPARTAAPAVGRSATASRGVALAVLFALLCTMLTAFNVLTQAQSAQAAPICEPGNITVNIGSGTPRLIQYSATGSVESEVAVPRSYTDIAYSSDGLTLYGILPGVPTLYTIDPATGVETASIPITGMPASGYFQNALSALPDGSLLTGAARNSDPVSQQIFRIDPTTGVATPFAASFPTGFGSAGDFLTLADGDVLAIGNGPAGNALFRIAPDATVTQVGTVPESFGAAQSGGRIYLAGSTGNLYEIASVPTAASTAPVATTTIASTGLPFFGATSQQDSGLCSEPHYREEPPIRRRERPLPSGRRSRTRSRSRTSTAPRQPRSTTLMTCHPCSMTQRSRPSRLSPTDPRSQSIHLLKMASESVVSSPPAGRQPLPTP